MVLLCISPSIQPRIWVHPLVPPYFRIDTLFRNGHHRENGILKLLGAMSHDQLQLYQLIDNLGILWCFSNCDRTKLHCGNNQTKGFIGIINLAKTLNDKTPWIDVPLRNRSPTVSATFRFRPRRCTHQISQIHGVTFRLTGSAVLPLIQNRPDRRLQVHPRVIHRQLLEKAIQPNHPQEQDNLYSQQMLSSNDDDFQT